MSVMAGVNRGMICCRVCTHVTCVTLANTSRACRSYATSSLKKEGANAFSPMGIFLLSVPVVTFGLGTWQVKRRQWKVNLIKEMEEKVFTDPIDFPGNLEDIERLEYRKVKVKGQFDHSKELYVLPRSPVENEAEGGNAMSGRAQTGANVITPFHIEDRDLTILINRGWVPRDKIKPHTRTEGQIKGKTEFVGVVRKSEQRLPFAGKNYEEQNQWSYKDLPAMSRAVNSEPILIDADGKSTVPGGPLGGQTRVTLRNEHASYIFTWYTLSAMTAMMWYMKYFKR